MSGWKIAVRRVYALGGEASLHAIDEHGTLDRGSLPRAAVLGLLRSPGRHGVASRWAITPLGEAWCEGRAVEVLSIDEGKRKPGRPTVRIAMRIPAELPETIMEEILIDLGFQPGQRIDADMMRRYSNRLAAIVRSSVLA